MAISIADQLAPIHPGEILTEEFLRPHRLSAYAAARLMHIPRTRLERLARGETPVTIDTAVRLARLFGTTPVFWMNLQVRHDLRTAEKALPADIAEIEPLQHAAA